jgi:fibronectin type 3 domain-containing protein
LVFSDTGNISIVATAYCDNGVTKFSPKIICVHKNPLIPPDSVYTKSLSDSSVMLYWKKVSVAKKYNVFRSQSATGVFSLIQNVNDTSFIDNTLNEDSTYYYKVSTIDSLNRESDQSSAFRAVKFEVMISKWDEMILDQNKWE